ncbi:MAG: zf-HC2 domain-containing protein [Thermodesulfobacteriota bacterium]|nr:zf-HC2 domain-containing protein [Thermodesulfobacteriota bacterium]
MSHWMFNCKEVSRRVSESMDHRLPLYQRMLIRMHLLMCKYCSRFRRQLLLLREFSRSPQLAEDFPDLTVVLTQDARERILQALKSSSH